MAMQDVTIRGAGIFGLSIAWACVSRGARVQVIDPYGAGSGSSGGLVGALAPHTPENWNEKKEFQFQSLIMAEQFWAEVDDISGQSSGYGRTGRLQPIADEKALELAHARATSAGQLWQSKAQWRVVCAADFADWAPVSATGYLIHDTLTARMHPRLACASLVAALQTRGVEIVREGPDLGQVVWATGYKGLERMSEKRGRLVGAGIKGQSALLRYDAPMQPQLFADALHIIPHADGTVGVGSTTERDFDDPSATDAKLEEVIERARSAVPYLRDALVIARWAGVRPRARSRAPMLGHHPFRPGQYVANGGFKIGFGMAPKAAQVMADLILDGQDAIPESFRPEANL